MADEPLVITPMPPLVVLLAHHEKQKGAPLTEAEVLSIRDRAVCIALPRSDARQMAEKRGYEDVSLENVWQEWNAIRKQVLE